MTKQPSYRFVDYDEPWSEKKLGELAEIVRGASPRPIQDSKWFDKESDVGWLRISDVTEQDGRIYKLEQRISKLGQEKTRVLFEPHLLLSIAATVGKPVVNYVKTGVHDGFLIFLAPRFDQEFLFQWLDMFRPQWQKYGQPGSQVNLNSDIVKNQAISLPSLPEQTAIGSFFQDIDQLISLQQRKLEVLKEQKKTYLKLLFPVKGQTKPALRFAGFEDEWKEVKLGEILVERNEQISESEEYQLMSFVQGKGVVPKSDRYDRSFLVKDDKKNYKKTEYGDFIYSSNNLDTGSIGFNKTGKALISPVYSIFYSKTKKESQFIAILSQRKEFINEMIKYRQGVVYGQFRIHESDFLNIKILAPESNEQEFLITFFQDLDKAIAKQEEKVNQLKESKQTLLRKMFI